MDIKYDVKNQIFHIYNNKISYIIKVLKNGYFGHLYYGKRLYGENFEHLYYEMEYPIVCYFGDDNIFSLDSMRQEYSSYGKTDFSQGAFKIRYENGSTISDFKYESFEITDIKPKYKDLPMSFGQSLTLKIDLKDAVSNVTMSLFYTIFEDIGIIARHTTFLNTGNEKIYLESALSAQLDFDTKEFDLIQLSGAWARERHVVRKKLDYGVHVLESNYGASGHITNPAFAILNHSANEFQGEVYGFNLMYSGSFIAKVEIGSHNRTRIVNGIQPNNFEWPLDINESFVTPEAFVAYSSDGINGMSHEFHTFILSHIMNPITKNKRTAFLNNNWEATYFDFDEEKILEIAKATKEVGAELFVLDDGWFSGRNDDTTSLGDWFVDVNKLPDGITSLSKKVSDLGLQFGLWFEPEMVSPKSELYKNHPEYVIQAPNTSMSYGRNQFVLDFTNPIVIDNIYEQMTKIIDDAQISYIKWDMNRYITEPYSYTLGKNQGMFMHKYILGVYSLYERLTQKYPNILFESCAGGGGRFDLGLLYYAPQTWTSDNTDPIERLKTQYGTSIFYPLKAMGAHVTVAINHQTGRYTSLDFKASVAYFGNFGYELDISKLTTSEKEIISQQMDFYNQNWELFHYGEFIRLESPFESNNNHVAWMVKNDDKIIVGAYNILYGTNQPIRRIYLKNLVENKIYIDINNVEYSGAELMYNGYLIINSLYGKHSTEISKVGEADFSSSIIEFTSK